MPNPSTPVPVKANDDPTRVPNMNVWRDELLPRYEARVRENLRPVVREIGRSACSLSDTTVKGVHKRIADQPWTEKGLNDLKNDEITKTEAMIDIVASAPTAQPREHLSQLDDELARVEEPSNWIVAQAIWNKLDALPPSDRNVLLSRTDDPQLVAAALHAPAIYQFGNDDARQRMLDNYNRAHRAQQYALADDLRTFLGVIDEITSGIKRELRRALR